MPRPGVSRQRLLCHDGKVSRLYVRRGTQVRRTTPRVWLVRRRPAREQADDGRTCATKDPKALDRALLSFQRPLPCGRGDTPRARRRYKCDQPVYPVGRESRKASCLARRENVAGSGAVVAPQSGGDEAPKSALADLEHLAGRAPPAGDRASRPGPARRRASPRPAGSAAAPRRARARTRRRSAPAGGPARRRRRRAAPPRSPRAPRARRAGGRTPPPPRPRPPRRGSGRRAAAPARASPRPAGRCGSSSSPSSSSQYSPMTASGMLISFPNISSGGSVTPT